jgi:CheY-like chemotaxis protein/anti-sigma regulatory factor (Ser/Thr protein kinase)
MAEEKGLSLEFDIPSGLPCISCDRNLLTQVLINLLNNAIKFTAKGKITAGVCRKGEYAEFFVADTGEGIYPEEKEVIFDEFYRIAGELPDRPRGSGLGLSIARKIVDYHGGAIRVDSTPGKGSTFFFTVPVAAEEPRISAEECPFVTTTPSERYGPILVIYQSTAIRQSLRKRLENLGYQTIGADTLKRGTEIAVSVRPVLIVSDISTGGDDFIKLEHWARDNRSVVMLANLYLNPVSGDLCLAASGYLDKPFDRYQIVSLFERFSKNKGRFFIISPEKDEARKLQGLLGAEGISADLYMDESEAVREGLVSVPDGVIIGTVPSTRLEDMVATLKGTAHFKLTPFFFIREGSSRQLRAVTPELLVRPNAGEGISPLIMAIEKAYAEKWGESTTSGG